MAGLFDFEKYYTNKVIKTSIKLDVSGLDVKSTASSSVMNEDGTVDEVDMNEYVTNNVMFKISSIKADGKDIKVSDRIVLTTDDIDGDAGDESKKFYLAIGYPLDDLIESGLWNFPDTYTGDLLGKITISKTSVDESSDVTLSGITLCGPDDSDNEGTAVSSLVITAVPRYALMNSSYPKLDEADVDTVNQNFWLQQLENSSIGDMSRALAAVGLHGDIYKGEKWASKQDGGKTGAVYKNGTFTKLINKISALGKENNLAVKITYFDDSYADTLNPPEQAKGESKKSYKKRIARADWTRTKMKVGDQMKGVYNKQINAFIKKCDAHDPNPLPNLYNHPAEEEDPITGEISSVIAEDATALIPNVSDAFKKLYDSKETLSQRFEEKFFETYDSIKSIAGVRPFMSSKLKRKLDFAKRALKKSVGANEPLEYYLDVASCCNLLDSMMHHGDDDDDDKKKDYVGFPLDTGSRKNGIRMIGSRDFMILLNQGRSKQAVRSDYNICSYDASSVSRERKNRALMYETVGNSLYRDWAIEHGTMTVSEIKSMLCDYFTERYNARNGVEEDENGYMKWYYEPSDDESGKAYKLDITIITEDKEDDDVPTAQRQIVTMYVEEPTDADWSKLDQNDGKAAVFSPSLLTNINVKFEGNSVVDMSVDYLGTARMFVDVAMREISSLINSRGESGVYRWSTLNDDDQIEVVEWDSCSTAGNCISFFDYRPMYQTIDSLGEATDYTINDCVKFSLDVMGDAIEEIDTIMSVQGALLGPVFLLIQKARLSGAKNDYRDLKNAIDRIKWYQKFTNESVFENKTFIGTRPEYKTCPYVNMPARFLIPVELFKRVRVKYKKFFRTRHKTVKKSIGVRWVEVAFIDTDVYAAYPQNTEEPMTYYKIRKFAKIDGSTLVFDEPLEGGDDKNALAVGDITQFGRGRFKFKEFGDRLVDVVFTDSTTFSYATDQIDFGERKRIYVDGIYVPLAKTAKSDNRTRVRVEYKMPYIPYDSEIRRWAFLSYGAFDQSPYASESREYPSDPDEKLPGWQIFHRSSKRIGDMRAGMGIYDAVSILMGILRNEFGASCVELAETMRSKEDQELVSTGGGESTLLSWHNYGLAAKILINDPSTGLPIEDGSDSMKRLIQIAKAFTTLCYNGVFGHPINVVWCGRLKMGANNFVWEFLPIGVNHKDAIKFRDSILNQEDPVASLGFIDVDTAGYVYDTRPDGKVPYVLRSSSTYVNALVINGKHFVSPRNIRNYVVPHDLVLKNILEFCNLIRAKMEANGSSLNGRANMFEWKTLNDRSYKQLLMYYGMTGSLSAARTLICGEYVETYRNIVDCKFSEDAVEMTREYLGSLYNDAKIFIEDVGDGGAWISLHDGKLHCKASNLKSPYSQDTKANFFGEKMVPAVDMDRGLYINGMFYTEEQLKNMGKRVELVSEHSYIDGLDDDGNVTGDDAMMLYRMISIQIKDAFDDLKERFENYGGGIMYDHFVDGPNAGMEDMVENEFGLIKGQDLIDFDGLEAIFAKKDVDEGVSQQYTDGEVYEKVVSNAELAGVRKASLTKEHVTVTVQQGGMTTEQLYKLITKGGMTQATDMFIK